MTEGDLDFPQTLCEMREILNIFTTNDKFDQLSGVVRMYKTTVGNDRR